MKLSYSALIRFRLSAFLLLIFLLVGILAPVQAAAAKKIDKVRVGIAPNKPMCYIDDSGKPAGIFVSVVEYAAAREGWDLVYVPDNFSTLLAKLSKGEIDILLSAAVSEERKKIYAYNDIDVFNNWAEIYILPASGINSLVDLKEKRVATLKEGIYTTGPEGIISLDKKFHLNSEFILVDNYRDALKAVKDGTADAAVVNRLVGAAHEKEYGLKKSGIVFSPVEIRFALNRESILTPQLIRALDQHMASLIEDKNSIYHQAVSEALGGTASMNLLPRWFWLLGVIGAASILILAGFVALLRWQVKVKASALQTSDKMFHSIFQTASDGILLADMKSKKFVNANKAMCEMLGYAPGEIPGIGVQDIHPEKDLPRVIEAFEKQARQEIIMAPELPVKRKDGTVFYADISSSPVTLEGQHYLIGIFRDVTDRIQAEQAILAEKNRAQNYLNIAGVMLTILNTDGDITLINQKGCEILNITEEEALGLNWFEHFLPTRMVAEVSGVFSKLMAGDIEPVEYYENPILTKEGRERIIAFHNTVIRDMDGNISGVLFSGNDITNYVMAIEKLKAQQTLFQNAIDAQTDTFFVFNPLTGKALQWNKSFIDISGYSAEEIATFKAPDSYYSGEQLKEAEEYIKKLQSGKSGTIELDLITKDGRTIPTEYSASLIKDLDGVTNNIIAVGRDISDRKKHEKEKANLETQLLQLQKIESIGTLAGGIAHDFNNILSIILGFTELALVRIQQDTHLEEDLGKVLDAGNRAKELVQQILSFSRKGDHELKPIRPSDIVNEAARLLKATIPASITVNIEIADESPVIIADPVQFHQVLMNLVTNAVHAMKEKGTLGITLSRTTLDSHNLLHRKDMMPGQYIKLSVSDTGAGMSKDTASRIFDPFFTTKKIGEGTGMGLAVVYGIVTSHHGMITVKSEPGKGSVFDVYFAVAEREEVESAEAEEDLPGGTERLLLVDDEDLLAAVGNRMLEFLGYQVAIKTSSREALNVFRSNPGDFDMVITDQTMPEMNGIELAQELLAIRPDIPIILYTGYSSQISEHKIRKLGIKELMMKPLDIMQLAKVIRKNLDEG